MISGLVTAEREAVIRLTVHGPLRRKATLEAVIDTGFDGWLTLPQTLVVALALPWRRRGRALLADGSESLFDIFEATVIWDKRRRRVSVDEVNSAPLVGMSLLDGYELNVRVCEGGMVSIHRLT